MEKLSDKYPHYWKKIPEGLKELDIYWVLRLWGVTSPELGHAIKKLLCPGKRHDKTYIQDITEARDTLNALLEKASFLHSARVRDD